VPRPGADPLIWGRDSLLAMALRGDPAFVVANFEELARMADPAWLDELFERHADELAGYEGALRAEGTLPANHTLQAVRGRLATRQAELRRRLAPDAAVHTVASLEVGDDDPQATGTLVVDVWATTRVPVFLDGFRFSNGKAIDARDALEARPGDGAVEVDGRLLLPTDGRRLRVRFAANARLATLRELRQVVDALALGGETDRRVELTIDLEHALAAGGPTRARRLAIRRVDPAWESTGGRPTPPTLEACLAQHPFLSYDVATRRMVVAPGTWDVDGDLVLPTGVGLQAGPGTVLRFGEPAVLVSDAALVLEGSADAPVELIPRDAEAGWAGIMVIDAQDASLLTYTTVRGTREVHRAGWSSTGGTTFYRSPLEARYALWQDAKGEDALNVFGAAFLLDRSRIQGSFSDAFDGDFVTGTVRDCHFDAIGADAIDTSGSEVRIEGCHFGTILDKAVSAGEVSRVEVDTCTVQEAMIGIAAKDGSRVDAREFRMTVATQFALAAYIKKPEYQASTIVIDGLRLGRAGRGTTIVQTGCMIELDGRPQPTEDLDVPDLYERGILGR
jgi:hypothetical protein